MANLRLPGAADLTRRVGLCLLLVVLVACSGGPSDPARLLPEPAAAPEHISAEWLRRQPGEHRGDFSFHLLDAAGRTIAAWSGLSLEQAEDVDTTVFTLSAGAAVPDDVYLYVTYPGERIALKETSLAPPVRDEYIMLAVPHRVHDVLVVGLARIGTRRGSSLAAGPLLQLEFTAGQERYYRAVSLVNQDPRSAPVLSIGGQSSGEVTLRWEERNIGDCNNNGLVEVADLTPVGIYYEQRVDTAPDPGLLRVVDGNLDGFITVADLTPIGSNYLRRIEGYTVYHAPGSDPQPEDFTALGSPTVVRKTVYDATPVDQQKKRLLFEYTAATELGWNNYYVRALSSDGGVESEGPASNILNVEDALINQPPYWVSTVGLTSAYGSGAGVAVMFGEARDIEDGAVDYILRYAPGELVIGAPATVEIVIPAADVAGDPPFAYFINGLVRGETYALLLRARDSAGQETDNLTVSQARVPAPGVSADTWPYHRNDPGRGGNNPAFLSTEPYAAAWTVDLSGGAPFESVSQPVLSATGWLAVRDRLGAILRYDLVDGTLLGTHPAVWPDEPAILALDGDTLVAATTSGLAVYNLAITDPPLTYDYGAQAAPLLLGDFIYTVGAAGIVRCLLIHTGTVEWTYQAGSAEAYSLAPVADAEYLYVASDTGRLDKLDLLTGESMQSANIGTGITGGGVALDPLAGRLYFSQSAVWLTEVDTADLAVLRTWEDELPADPSRAAPCLLTGRTPPLALVADNLNGLYAANLATGAMEWLTGVVPQVAAPPYRTTVTCGSNRIYLASQSGGTRCYDFAGNLRQPLATAGVLQSEVILGGGRLAWAADGQLQVFSPAADDPPVWQGHAGVRELVTGDGRVEVQWDYAVDDHGEPVHYAIYYRAGQPPELTAPFTNTTLITDIPHTGATHAQWVDGLVNGTRYYFAVRAYDGLWADSPNIDANTNVLGATPPWQRHDMLLGDDLPAGEIYYMRGMVSPDGNLHLVYNDEADTHLTHLTGELTDGQPSTVVWSMEGPGLAAYSAIGFEPAWDSTNDRLVLGWATAGDVGTLTRTGDDTWQILTFPDTLPGINPQVSLQFGAETALAYTQHIELGPVENHIDYYLKRTIAGLWQPVEPLEETNLSGRDLDLVLNPADGLSPWVALQRGGESTPNRHTPQEGECLYARWDAGGGNWTYELVDAGANAPDSDCGKRVQQVLDATGHPHLAYMDLDASATEPRGQLKYATHDGVDWTTETLDDFGLSFQTADLQFTWGELGITMLGNQPGGTQPVVACLDRQTGSGSGEPHLMIAKVWVRRGPDDWRFEQVTDAEWVFPRDREPCVLLQTTDTLTGYEYLSLFYVTTSDPDTPDSADVLVHLWREYRPVV